MFENSIRTFSLLRAKKQAIKKQQEEQKLKLTEDSRTTAELGETLKRVNMLLECPQIKRCGVMTPEKKENLINKYMYGEELENYVVEKEGLEFFVKYRKIEI